MLERVASAQDWPLTLVDEIHVFGSFARGALEPHDVDVVVEFTSDRKYTLQAARAMSRGGSSDAVLRQALAAGTRGTQI